jgi:hypothetical protein
MAKRVFISFAAEDSKYRDFLVGQARNNDSPFEFVDMSVKEPWSDNWKTRCRVRIKGCDGFIALITKRTPQADGQLWEIACGKEEKVPMRGMYVSDNERPSQLPKELEGVRIINWTWDNIKNFIDSL